MKTQKLLTPLAMAMVALLSVGAYGGVKVAAGDDNPRANAAPIAIAGSGFVYGSASAQAVINACQSRNKALTNYGVPNNVSLTYLAEGESGNLDIHIAAGNSNQPKNYMAVESSETVYTAGANVDTYQDSNHIAIASNTPRCDRQWL
ncbi:MAG: hypothetical protein R6V43_05270 [Halopseudomonas sp.]